MVPTSPEESEEKDDESDTDDEDFINLETKLTNEYFQVNENEHLNNSTCSFTMDNVDDNMDDFLLSSLDPDIDVVDNNYPLPRGDESYMEQYINNIQTTNAGEYTLDIVHETEYGGTFGNIKISRSILLNQCGTLMTRKKY